MKSFAPSLPYTGTFELWSRFAADHAAMLLAAGDVIGRRTARMAAHGITPDAGERREMQRMVEEKHSAAVEGSIAAWQEWIRLGQANWLEAMQLTISSGIAFAPTLTGVAASARRAGRPDPLAFATATRRWMASLDTSLRIVDAALKPARTRVAANQKRLST